jgi:hypothetical protein
MMTQCQVAKSHHRDYCYKAACVIFVGNSTENLLICHIRHVYDCHFCIVCIHCHLSHELSLQCGLVIWWSLICNHKLCNIFV